MAPTEAPLRIGSRQQDLEARLVGAALRSPSRFLGLVGTPESLSAALRPILRRLRPSDPDFRSLVVSDEMGFATEETEALRALAGGRDPRSWLADLEDAGNRETPESVRAVVAELRDCQRAARARADLRAIGALLVKAASESGAPIEGLAQAATEAGAGIQRARGALEPSLVEAFLSAARTYADMREHPAPEPPALLGDGLFRPSMVALLHGADGSRKSWASLALAACAACGREWFGLATRPEGASVAYVSLEDPESLLRHRLDSICEAMDLDRDLVDSRLVLVSPPAFAASLDVTGAPGQEALDRLVLDHSLDFLILDHLSMAHMLPDERDLRPAVAPLQDLARRREVAVLLLTHNRKTAADISPGADRGAARGDSRLTASCRLVLSIFEARGRIVIRTVKSTWAAKPDDIYLTHAPGGALVLADAPESPTDRATANRNTLLACIAAAGADGIRLPEAKASLSGLSERTVRLYLDRLAKDRLARCEGKTTLRRWFATPEGQTVAGVVAEDAATF